MMVGQIVGVSEVMEEKKESNESKEEKQEVKKDIETEVEEEEITTYPYDARVLEYSLADRWDVHDLNAIDVKNNEVRAIYIQDQKEDELLKLLRQRWQLDNEYDETLEPLTVEEKRKVQLWKVCGLK